MPLPLTNTADHVCFFRHALALDECRVKFIPEYLSKAKLLEDTAEATPPSGNQHPQNLEEEIYGRRRQASKPDEIYTSKTPDSEKNDKELGSQRNSKMRPSAKEVWFAGSHSDM